MYHSLCKTAPDAKASLSSPQLDMPETTTCFDKIPHKEISEFPNVNQLQGNLVQMALQGAFDLIAHGCNCFHTMNAGLALQLATRFPAIRHTDRQTRYGDRGKLGTYSSTSIVLDTSLKGLTILNCYTQYLYGRPKTGKDGLSPHCDYAAIRQVMAQINSAFTGQHLGIPRIGAGLAGGRWSLIERIILNNTQDLRVTIVHFPNKNS
jgi:O-acetyl-ADP-ribose deacetylase (regulator of RNase III)